MGRFKQYGMTNQTMIAVLFCLPNRSDFFHQDERFWLINFLSCSCIVMPTAKDASFAKSKIVSDSLNRHNRTTSSQSNNIPRFEIAHDETPSVKEPESRTPS